MPSAPQALPEGNEMPAGVEHRDCQRLRVGVAPLLQRGIDDGGSLSKRQD
jgi:hypothetical protein